MQRYDIIIELHRNMQEAMRLDFRKKHVFRSKQTISIDYRLRVRQKFGIFYKVPFVMCFICLILFVCFLIS